jgi:hypothetical protein
MRYNGRCRYTLFSLYLGFWFLRRLYRSYLCSISSNAQAVSKESKSRSFGSFFACELPLAAIGAKPPEIQLQENKTTPSCVLIYEKTTRSRYSRGFLCLYKLVN